MKLTDYAVSKGGTSKAGCPILASIAKAAECSPATLYMISLGHKSPSARLANRIAAATDDEVTTHDLLPEVFGPPPANTDEGDQQEAA